MGIIIVLLDTTGNRAIITTTRGVPRNRQAKVLTTAVRRETYRAVGP